MDTNNNLKNHLRCKHCNINYTNKNEWIFHIKVTCPVRTRSSIYMDSKKNRLCYRCGRMGHYYKQKECYAFTDNNGVEITWGIRRNPSKKRK